MQLIQNSEDFLNNIADKQYQSAVNLSSFRGGIYDHRKAPLAISIKTPSVAVNPKIFSPNKSQTLRLAKMLKLPVEKVRATSKKNSYFSWLKRKVTHDVAKKIKSLKIRGLHFILEPARFYPGGTSASHLLGLVGTDNTGLLGLEQSYEGILKGAPSKLMSLRDAKGQQIIMNADQVSPEKSGNNIILTIDRAIQGITEEALKNGVRESQSKSGFVIVMDPHTGRLLSIANHPTFNPNTPSLIQMKNTTNHSIAYRFEPGSVMKPFIVAAALEKGLTTADEIHPCEKNGKYAVAPGLFIHDDHPKDFLSTEEILIRSSNICTFKIAERLGESGTFMAYKSFGFGKTQQILKLPGMVSGSIMNWKKWSPIRFANISFGQGLLVTGLEVALAYSAIANGGHLLKPFIIQRIESSKGEIIEEFSPVFQDQVISSVTSQQLRNILGRVVTEGTGKRASTQSYTTGGKTGTAEKIDPDTRSYSKSKRIANFAGFAPLQNPHIVVYVVLDEPQKKPYYGGYWAAPVFSEIVEKTLKYLNVAPDQKDLANS